MFQTEYHLGFAPFIVAAKNLIPYPEEFKGQGNYDAFLFQELHLRGFHFMVLSDVFVVQQEDNSPSKDIVDEEEQARVMRTSSVWKTQLLQTLGAGSRQALTRVELAKCNIEVAKLREEIREVESILKECQEEVEYLSLKEEFL
jgi:hypothetical protein